MGMMRLPRASALNAVFASSLPSTQIVLPIRIFRRFVSCPSSLTSSLSTHMIHPADALPSSSSIQSMQLNLTFYWYRYSTFCMHGEFPLISLTFVLSRYCAYLLFMCFLVLWQPPFTQYCFGIATLVICDHEKLFPSAVRSLPIGIWAHLVSILCGIAECLFFPVCLCPFYLPSFPFGFFFVSLYSSLHIMGAAGLLCYPSVCQPTKQAASTLPTSTSCSMWGSLSFQ